MSVATEATKWNAALLSEYFRSELQEVAARAMSQGRLILVFQQRGGHELFEETGWNGQDCNCTHPSCYL